MIAKTGVTRAALSVLAVLVLIVMLVVASRRIDLHRAALELRQVRPAWIIAALVCYLAILPLWAAQWRLLAPRGGGNTFAAMLGVVCMTSSVLNTTPLLVGEAAGVQFLASQAGVDRVSGVAVLAMDQLLVGIAKLGVLCAAAALLPLPASVRHGLFVLGWGVAALASALLLLVATVRRGHDWLHRHPRLGAAIVGATRTLGALRAPRRGGAALLLAFAKKGCELAAILSCQHAFGITLPPSSALLVLAALNVATLLPLVPGNVGVFETAIIVAYAWLGVAPERALGLAVVQHLCYVVALALPGYAWLARGVPRRSAAATP